MADVIGVVVIDDHPVVAHGLAAVLGDFNDVAVLGTAHDVPSAAQLVERTRPQVALLDIELGDDTGVTLLAQLPRLSPTTRALIFTAYDDDERIFSAIDAGAQGVVLKGAPVADIVGAIRRVHGGESYLEPRLASRVLARLRAGRGAAVERPSERQKQVLVLVAEGLASAQIAARLGISERTVKFHLRSIFDKLGADNRAQAVALAIERGWL
jgi:DNA-binding NarL/FixJ family response regulator